MASSSTSAASSSTLQPPMVSRAHATNSSSCLSLESHEEEESLEMDYDNCFEAEDEDEPLVAASNELQDVVLSSLDLAAEQEKQIEQVSSLFGINRLTASTLLRRFQWKTERLIESYYEDQEAVLAKAGLGAASSAKLQRSGDGDASSAAQAADGEEEVTCGVCFCESPLDETSALGCGHRFCNECWEGHLRAQIDDGHAERIRCMQHQCEALVQPSLVQALLDSATYARYARYAERQFVDDNPYLKYCPASGCENVIKVADLGRSEAKCSCGMTFCIRCSRAVHFPMSCSLLSRWEDRVKGDAADGQWIQANSRRCQKCHTHIEKNGGCNWIHCRCGHQFCYFCYSTDKGHHGQLCNAPPPPEAQDAQSSLMYFMHYFDRYDGHRKSEELETQLRTTVTARMEDLLADPSTKHIRVDVDYLLHSADLLIACRRLLKNTYPFAFYLKPQTNVKAIFEHLQARLEAVTEGLAGLLEAEGEPDKRKIIDTTADAKVRLARMREMLESSPSEPEAWE